MRQLIIDTETTGLDPKSGHRIIEFAALELVDRRPTGRTLHFHFNPERDIDFGATEVHGKTWEDLKDRPCFRERAAEIVDFLRGAEWIIHNAPFDLAFIDVELTRESLPGCPGLYGSVIDTLTMARDAFPGKRNNLDALCERFGVSNAHRTLHGALLDAQLLAEVYLAMTRGQETLSIDIGSAPGHLVDRRRRVRGCSRDADRHPADAGGACGARGVPRGARQGVARSVRLVRAIRGGQARRVMNSLRVLSSCRCHERVQP
jgi:DNA polymerase-3 subunit epsilon